MYGHDISVKNTKKIVSLILSHFLKKYLQNPKHSFLISSRGKQEGMEGKVG